MLPATPDTVSLLPPLLQAVGAPIGAAMLTHLPPRQVEFAVGCLMLGVILLNCLRKKPSDSTADQAKDAG